jgi:hypothetical protein
MKISPMDGVLKVERKIREGLRVTAKTCYNDAVFVRFL